MCVFQRKPYARFHIYIYNMFQMYSCFLLLLVTLFVYHFAPVFEVSKNIVCFSASDSSFFRLSASVSLTFHLH